MAVGGYGNVGKKVEASIIDVKDPIFFDAVDLTDPGNYKTLITFTVPTSIERYLANLVVVCRLDSQWRLMADANQIATGLTGAAHPVDTFVWFINRPIAAGVICKLELKGRTGSPITDCAAHIVCADLTIP